MESFALGRAAGRLLRREPRRTLILGGARSGKSAEAERRMARLAGVTYVATGGHRSGDAEWAARVRTHQERRPATWRTIETTDLVPLLLAAPGPLLIDCLALWLTAVLDEAGAWDPAGDAASVQAVIDERVAGLVAAWRRVKVPVVAVTNEVGMGVVPATPAGRRFRDELGRLNAAMAAASDQVLLVVAGQVLRVR